MSPWHVGNQSAFTAWPLTAPFDFACAHGFDAFEWFPDKKSDGTGWAAAEFSAPDREFAFKSGRSRQLTISLHAATASTPLNPAGCELLQQDIALARDVGASILVLHVDLSAGVDTLITQLAPVIAQLRIVNIHLALENTVMSTPGQVNALFSRLHELDLLSDGFIGLCFDVGHANLCSSTLNNYINYLDLLDPIVPILHVHLHENLGDTDSHLLVFTGPAGKDATGIRALIKRLRKRSFTGSIILEQWPNPPEPLIEARNKLLDLIHEMVSE